MEFADVVKERRSVRAYLDKEVPDDVVYELLEYGRLAPSAGNIQPWVFIVSRDKEIRDKLVNATFRGIDENTEPHYWLQQAPILITICSDRDRVYAKYKERGQAIFQYLDIGATIENISLGAVAHGLGTCWIGSFSPTKTAEILGVPSYLEPVSILSLGYPDPA